MKISNLIVRLLPSGEYVTVFIGSRVVDIVLLVGIPIIFGKEYLWLGWFLGISADIIVEFFGHRRHTYKQLKVKTRLAVMAQFFAYSFSRLIFAGIAAGAAWFFTSGEVGWMLAGLYIIFSVFSWLLQVQVIRLIYKFKIYRRYIKSKVLSRN